MYGILTSEGIDCEGKGVFPMDILVAGEKRSLTFGVIYQTDDPLERQKGIYAIGQVIVMEKGDPSYDREIGSRCDPHKSGYMLETYDRLADAIERSEEIWEFWIAGDLPIVKYDPDRPKREKHKKRREKQARNAVRRGQQGR